VLKGTQERALIFGIHIFGPGGTMCRDMAEEMVAPKRLILWGIF
jgi:hypothetical protein